MCFKHAVILLDFVASVTADVMSTEHWWNDSDRGKVESILLAEKPAPVPLFPPQIQHGLAWD